LQLIVFDEGVVLVAVDDRAGDVGPRTYGMNIGPVGAAPYTSQGTEWSQIAEGIAVAVSFGVDVGSVVVEIPLTACRVRKVPGRARDG
jgi:hypothetical protein